MASLTIIKYYEEIWKPENGGLLLIFGRFALHLWAGTYHP